MSVAPIRIDCCILTEPFMRSGFVIVVPSQLTLVGITVEPLTWVNCSLSWKKNLWFDVLKAKFYPSYRPNRGEFYLSKCCGLDLEIDLPIFNYYFRQMIILDPNSVKCNTASMTTMANNMTAKFSKSIEKRGALLSYYSETAKAKSKAVWSVQKCLEIHIFKICLIMWFSSPVIISVIYLMEARNSSVLLIINPCWRILVSV